MTPQEPAAESAETAVVAKHEPGSPTPTEPLSQATTNWIGMFLAALFWPVLIGFLVAVFYPPFRAFVFAYWWAFVILPGVVVIIGLFPKSRAWLETTRLATRAGLFIFVVLPLLLAVVVGIAMWLEPQTRLVVLRVVFLVVVCLLPAMMWYLFIVTRKASLLNEFIANLDRLGLLQRGDDEAEVSRKRRVESYLQKFEATYGDLRDTIHDDVLNNQFKHYTRADAVTATTLSTATVPVALSTVLFAIGWLITLPPGQYVSTSSSWLGAVEPTAAPVTFAFLGAYFFSLQMLFRRYVRKDLGGTAYVAASIRIILAVIGIWVLAALGEKTFSGGVAQSDADKATFLSWNNQLLMAGFVIGVFPRVIWQIIESLFVKVARFAVPSMMSQLPVSDLDGFTVWHEARLEEEDIENIPNMASADLVELLLNTRLPPERIIDWTDQAILYTQLGPQRKQQDDNTRHKLRIHGIRTATSLLQTSAEARRQGNREAFEKILTDAKGDTVMPMLEASLTTNSNLKLIQRWRGMLNTPSRSSTQIGPHSPERGERADEAGQLTPSVASLRTAAQ